jgi:hypothetical protein
MNSSKLNKKLISDLNKFGYSKMQTKTNLKSFYETGKKLGQIFTKCDVKIDPEANAYLLGKDSMNYHMDHVLATYIGWYGMKKNTFYEPTYLIDSRNIVKKLTKKELEIASKIPYAKGEMQTFMYNKNNKRFYHCPWLVNLDGVSASDKQKFKKLLLKINELIKLEDKTKRIEIHLDKNEAFFIDSRFILHGRWKLNPNSKRHLRRIWISAE